MPLISDAQPFADDPERRPRRQLERVPDPPAYVPAPDDPAEAATIAQYQARNGRHPGEIIEETQP